MYWTGKHFKPKFGGVWGLEIPVQAAQNRCLTRMFAQNPLPNIYSYISSYQNPKQTKSKASNNRKQSRIYSHNPDTWYRWANLKHPYCQKETILPLLFPPYFLLLQSLPSTLKLIWLDSEHLKSRTQWETDPSKYSCKIKGLNCLSMWSEESGTCMRQWLGSGLEREGALSCWRR